MTDKRQARSVALLTDYGISDWYVAVLKAVIVRHTPGVTLIDISHDVAPGDIAAGSFILQQCWQSFPEGTVFLAVIDPGVGSARRALALHAAGRFFVGPDNGLFGFLAGLAGCYEIDVRGPDMPMSSATFHGRDIFAPAAAQLAAGAHPQELGPARNEFNRLETITPRILPDRVDGWIVYVDHFGNVITNLSRAECPAWVRSEVVEVRAADRRLPLSRTFSDVPPGEALAYFGSGGLLEIAVNGGHAGRSLKLRPGNPVAIALCRPN